MASQIRSATHVRDFISHLGRILVSIVIALSFLGVSIPQVQAADETISGKITSAANGLPISGMSVAALDENNNWVGWTDTDANGDYVLAGLAYGDYRIIACAECNPGTNAFVNTYYHGEYTFESATVITLSEGNNQAGINIALPLGNTIRGTVTDNNSVALQGITIGAVVWDDASGQWTWFKSIDTDSNGDYQLTGLLDGDYYVQACPECSGKYYLGEYYDGKKNIEDAQSFHLVNQTTQQDVDFTLESAAILTGHVADSSGTALANVPVSADNLGDGSNFNAWSDNNGNYSLNVAPGTYHVHTQLNWNGDYTDINLVDQYYNNHDSNDDSDTVSLTAGITTPNIDFTLHSGNTITGTVTDTAETPQPLQDIQVMALDWQSGNWIKTVTTDADGNYTMTGLGNGDYRIQACPECSQQYYIGRYYANTSNYDAATALSLSGSIPTSGINFTLDPAAIITGHVADSDGNALTNVPVSADNLDDGSNFNAWSDNKGNYSLNVEPGRYHVHTQLNWNGEHNAINLVDQYYNHHASVDESDTLDLTVNTTTPNIDFSLQPGNTITGTVTDTAEPPVSLKDIRVAAIRWDTGEWLKDVLTDDSGAYTLTGLPDGDYRIQACPECSQQPYLSRYYNNTENYDAATPLSLSGSGTDSGIDFTLNPAALISGKITSSSDGSAIANVPIQAENSQTGEGFGTWSDENGDYTINVKPGNYRLRTAVEWNGELDSKNYVNQIYDHALNFEEAPLINAVLGTPQTGYDFALEQGGILSGTITGGDGAPLADATVMAIAADGSRRSYGSQPTGSDGVYTLRGLPAGNYILRAMHEGNQALYFGGSANWNTNNLVTVAAGETTGNKDFVLPAQTGEDPNLLTVHQSATIAEMYDPGWTEYVQNAYLVDQIFSGMSRISPVDGSTLPNLSAESTWKSDNDDYIHWNFTLRDGLTWSDGSPLTAADIRFALLRNLKMNGVVDDMMIIEGAEAYNKGTAGADAVKISLDAGNPNVIHFTLTHEFAFFPTLMSTMAARPLPQLLIQAFPDSWLSLDKLITSGPYRLIERDADHVLLQKNPNFIDADSVQIQQVVMKSGASTDTAWNEYMNGELDTAVIPTSKITAANSDPDTKDQLNLVSLQCTFFVGFNPDQIQSTLGLSGDKAALLRKALIEAIDRDAFNAQTASGGIAAWTFIPLGVIGHSEADSTIYPAYNPTQAQADLDLALGSGYTLPSIPLYYPTDVSNTSLQRAQMEFLANAWNQTFDDAHFTVVGIPYEQYDSMLIAGQMFAPRRGWCSDYNDGYNFLTSLDFMSVIFGDWQNDAYNNLLSQAVGLENPADRAQKYQQAEEILLKTDAMMLPLYYTVSPILSRGFIRSFGVGGLDYIADWQLERTDTMPVGVPPSASLSSGQAATVFTPDGEEGRVSYSIPSGAFADGTTLIHTGHLTYDLTNLPEGLQKTSLYFSFTAEDTAHAQVNPAVAFALTVHYAQTEIDSSNLMENSLSLYYWDEAKSSWVKDTGSHVDPATNTITTSTKREGKWLVLGSTVNAKVFIPIVTR